MIKTVNEEILETFKEAAAKIEKGAEKKRKIKEEFQEKKKIEEEKKAAIIKELEEWDKENYPYHKDTKLKTQTQAQKDFEKVLNEFDERRATYQQLKYFGGFEE